MAATLLKVTAKIGIPVGAVYLTASNDIWTTETAKIHKTMTQYKELALADTLLEKQPVTRATNWAANQYNSAVKTVFSGFSQTPAVAASLSKDVYKTLNDQISGGEKS